MAIDTLTAALIEWLGAQDAAMLARIPDFIKSAEAEFSRQLRLG